MVDLVEFVGGKIAGPRTALKALIDDLEDH
jgi:hypothetical protein